MYTKNCRVSSPCIAVPGTARLQMYVIYFPAHCAGVTDMSPHYNLSPVVKVYHQHLHMECSGASQNDYRLVRIAVVLSQCVVDVLHLIAQ